MSDGASSARTKLAAKANTLMDEILKQLGELVLGSVPTICFFLLLIAAYNALVHRPLMRILAERRARTTGAMEQAHAAIEAAEAETQEYEARLRAARMAIFHQRELRLKELQAEREEAIAAARETARERVKAALQLVELSTAEARHQVEAVTGQLAAEILKAILPPGVSASAGAEGIQ